MPLLEPYTAPNRLVVDQLRRAPLFAALPTDRGECLSVLREGAVFEIPAGVEIVSPGDAPALLVLAEGALCDKASGQAWSAGSYLGVSETLAGRPFQAVIGTVAPSVLYRLDGRLLQDFMALCPAIATRMMADLAEAAATMLPSGESSSCDRNGVEATKGERR